MITCLFTATATVIVTVIVTVTVRYCCCCCCCWLVGRLAGRLVRSLVGWLVDRRVVA